LHGSKYKNKYSLKKLRPIYLGTSFFEDVFDLLFANFYGCRYSCIIGLFEFLDNLPLKKTLSIIINKMRKGRRIGNKKDHHKPPSSLRDEFQ